MSAINNGGPAFPPAVTVSASGDVYHGFDGMTLRDWFAGQALSGQLANRYQDQYGECQQARRAYEYADAMIAAREVKP